MVADGQNASRAVVLMGAAEELASSVGTFSVWFPSLIRYHTECIQAACRASISVYTRQRIDGAGIWAWTRRSRTRSASRNRNLSRP